MDPGAPQQWALLVGWVSVSVGTRRVVWRVASEIIRIVEAGVFGDGKRKRCEKMGEAEMGPRENFRREME